MMIRLLVPSEASLALPPSCPVPPTRALKKQLPRRVRLPAAAKASGGPIVLRCSATSSSGFILSFAARGSTVSKSKQIPALHVLFIAFVNPPPSRRGAERLKDSASSATRRRISFLHVC